VVLISFTSSQQLNRAQNSNAQIRKKLSLLHIYAADFNTFPFRFLSKLF